MDKHRLDKAKIEERMERAATAKKRKEAIVNQEKLRKQQEERERKARDEKIRQLEEDEKMLEKNRERLGIVI